MEHPLVVMSSGSDQACAVADSSTPRTVKLRATWQPHRPASFTLAPFPSLLSNTTLNYISNDPEPFPSGCAQPSSTPLTHQPKHPPLEPLTPPETNSQLGPAFLGSLYTMGDSSSKQMVSPGKVHEFPELPPLPGFLGALNDTPVGKVVEQGLLWWINRGRERPRFEFFLDKGAADKRVDSVKEGWLVPPEVSSSTVVECPLKEAWSCAKLDDTMFRLVPDKRQVRSAKRIIRRQMGGWAARNFRGTPIFAAHNFNIVMPTENGVQWYTPCFLDKSHLVSALDRSVDLHFDGLIRSRRAQRYNSLDPGGSSGGLGGPPSDGENLEEESSLLDPSDMKDLMEEAPAGATAGMNKMLFHLMGVYIQDTFDEIVLGNKWARRAVGLQPRFTIFADSFEDCAAAAEAAAVAQDRFNQELARGLDDPKAEEPLPASCVHRWGPDSFKDSGPPGSTLLGDVVREVDAKRFGAGLLDGTAGVEESKPGSETRRRGAVDTAAGRELDSRGQDIPAEKRGGRSDVGDGREPESRTPSKEEQSKSSVPRVGEVREFVTEEKAAARGSSDGAGTSGRGTPVTEGSGNGRPSDSQGSDDRESSDGVTDKKWWEPVSKHPASQREALSADKKRTDGVVVNRGPGWEIVRRGPFWNRQYELEQVAEKPGADSSKKASGSQAEPTDGRAGTDAGAGIKGVFDAREGRRDVSSVGKDSDNRSLEGLMEAIRIQQKRISTLAAAKAEGSLPTSEKEPREALASEPHKDSTSSGQNEQAVRGNKQPGNPEEGVRGERGTRPRGRYISQQEWDDVKASVKEKLEKSDASGAAARQQKWEALKASVEAKLAVKYHRAGQTQPKAAGDGNDTPGGSGPGGRNGTTDDLESPRGKIVSTRGVGPEAETRKGRDVKSVAHASWEEFAEPQAELHPKPEGLLEAAAAHLGLAGVLRDQSRMALIAVAAGSPQEKDLQGALDAVTRDIHAKPSAGSETSLMFIANTGALFAPAGQKTHNKGA